jgi:hypothetical protein
MTARIRVGPSTASVNGDKWSSSNLTFARMCQGIADMRPVLYEPDMEWAAARYVADTLHGEVIASEPAAKLVKGRVY